MATVVTRDDVALYTDESTRRWVASRMRVAGLFDRALEAGWLAAVVIVPLIFGPNLTSVFGVPKSSFLWCIAAIMAVLFLLKAAAVGVVHPAASPDGSTAAAPTLFGRSLAAWRLPWSRAAVPGGAPLIAAALTVGTVTVLATVASVAPAVSWWGHYGTFTGLFTLLSLIVIFAIVATHLRTRRQFDWLLVATVWASVPFLRFGAAQKWNFSPLPWAPDISPSLVFSPAGDPLATGAYLAAIIPLTLYLALASRALEFRLIYLLLALAQLGVLALSGFAGAWVGTACGLFALALLIGSAAGTATSRRMGRLAATLVALVTLAGLAFYARAQDSSWQPTGWLRSAVDGAHNRSSALDYRRQVWQGTWDLGLQRPVLGWGPDTFASTFGRTAPLALQAATDRGGQRPPQPFNVPLDVFQSSGLLGVLAWLGTLVAFFGTALALLRRRTVYSRQGHLAAAALVAAIVAYLITSLLTLPGLPAMLLFWIVLALAAALAGPLWHDVDAPTADDILAEGARDAAAGPAALEGTQAAEAAVAPTASVAPNVEAAPLPTDRWRGIGALLAVGVLALYLVPVAPLGLFWQSVQQVRADGWNHDGVAAEGVSDAPRSAQAYRHAFAAAPFQPYYALNAGRGVLQTLAAGATANKPAQLVLLRESERDLVAAHRLDPWDVAVSVQLARLWGVWASVTGQDRFAEAQRLINTTESQHPHDVAIITDWAQAAQQLGHPTETVSQYARLGAAAPHDAGVQLQAASALSTLVDTVMQAQPPRPLIASEAVKQGLDAAHRAADLTPGDPGAAWLQIAALSYKNAQVVVTTRGGKDARSRDAVRQMLDAHNKALTYRPTDTTTITNAIKAAFFLRDARAAYRLAVLGLRAHPGDPTYTQVIRSLPKSARQ